MSPRVVAFHGSPGTTRSWAPVFDHLPASADAVAPSLPGHGRGEPEPPLAMEARYDGVAVTPDTVVVGHSFGGVVAWAATESAVVDPAALVLVEPVLVNVLAADHDAIRTLEEYVLSARTGRPNAVATMIDLWFGPGSFALLDERQREFLERGTATNAVDVASTLQYHPDLVSMERRGIPTTIVVGSRSGDPMASICQGLVDAIPHARLHVVDGGDHSVVDTHPAEIAAIIADHMPCGA